jgi:glutamine phosphoribosylpyrophosphate amidotransferase
MKSRKLIVTVSSDDQIFDIDNKTKVYIFENVSDYKEELCDILEENKLSYLDLENLIKSWGGKVDLVPISLLVKKYLEKK